MWSRHCGIIASMVPSASVVQWRGPACHIISTQVEDLLPFYKIFQKRLEFIDFTSAQTPRVRASNHLRTWVSTCSGCFRVFDNSLKMSTSMSRVQPQGAKDPRDPQSQCEREPQSQLLPPPPNSALCNRAKDFCIHSSLFFLVYPLYFQ